jgi:hypothetical protein
MADHTDVSSYGELLFECLAPIEEERRELTCSRLIAGWDLEPVANAFYELT